LSLHNITWCFEESTNRFKSLQFTLADKATLADETPNILLLENFGSKTHKCTTHTIETRIKEFKIGFDLIKGI